MPTPTPTEEFLKQLNDRTKWKIVTGVPVFRAHERVLPAYTDSRGRDWPEVVIRVTKRGLEPIAVSTRRAGPQVLTEGHRNPDPTFPEHLQPKLAGWETHHRVGEYDFGEGKGREPCILADFHYDLSRYEETGPHRYPFRSVDYDFHEKRLAGTALLIRRPFFNLGLIPYRDAAGRVTIVQYAMGTSMPDEFTPEEEAQYAKMCRYMKAKYAKLAAYMDDTNPGEAQYAAENETLKRQLATEQSERLLGTVSGKVKYNKDRELRVLVGLSEAERPAHVAYMLETYEKLPDTMGDVRPATGATITPAGGGNLTQQQMTAAIQYMDQAKVDFAAARTWALANVK